MKPHKERPELKLLYLNYLTVCGRKWPKKLPPYTTILRTLENAHRRKHLTKVTYVLGCYDYLSPSGRVIKGLPPNHPILGMKSNARLIDNVLDEGIGVDPTPRQVVGFILVQKKFGFICAIEMFIWKLRERRIPREKISQWMNMFLNTLICKLGTREMDTSFLSWDDSKKIAPIELIYSLRTFSVDFSKKPKISPGTLDKDQVITVFNLLDVICPGLREHFKDLQKHYVE